MTISYSILLYKRLLNTQIFHNLFVYKKSQYHTTQMRIFLTHKGTIMRLYYFLSNSVFFIFITTLIQSAPLKNRSDTFNNNQKPVILFDLMNVLIKENQATFNKKIGYGTIASYTLTHWKHPGYRCLDMLEAMSKHETQKPHIHITLKQRTMPRCLIELQEGKKTALQTKNEILSMIDLLDNQKHFNSSKEKMLMTSIISTILDPEITSSMIEPIKQTIHLVQKLKSAGYTLYIFANAPDELYKAVQKKYPEIINLFDGSVISSQIKTAKPSTDMFNHLFTTHNLAPHNCILIDDLQETVSTAKQLGMQAFVCDKNVLKKLKQYGVIVK